MAYKVDGNMVIEATGTRPDGEKTSRQWTFNDPGQVAKHAPQFAGLSKGDLSAVTDAANDTKKQIAS